MKTILIIAVVCALMLSDASAAPAKASIVSIATNNGKSPTVESAGSGETEKGGSVIANVENAVTDKEAASATTIVATDDGTAAVGGAAGETKDELSGAIGIVTTGKKA